MIQFHVFPGGKKRVVTFSYDDGPANDVPLVALFNKYGVKATFHLNGINYVGATEEKKEELRRLYEGHEVACHTLRHGWPARCPQQSVVLETLEDRRILEDIFGYPIIGMSYPSGSYDAESIAAMEACGIVYSRTVVSTRNFAMPKKFMEWHPTCHHTGAYDLCDKFMADLDSMWTHPVFYIWGHSYAYRTEEDWAKMETLLQKLSGNDKIWYATNIEIYNYIKAVNMLQISADETVFYNPSAQDVWVEKDKKDIIHIPAGQRISIK
jgi:hypothetical protein